MGNVPRAYGERASAEDEEQEQQQREEAQSQERKQEQHYLSKHAPRRRLSDRKGSNIRVSRVSTSEIYRIGMLPPAIFVRIDIRTNLLLLRWTSEQKGSNTRGVWASNLRCC